ncbi:MAG: FeoB small GTPase domain-containing protein [Desulfotomaculales bacterium]
MRTQPVVALAGNPNTGKSTIFNALTGLNQHTGNWPGKTVQKSWGTYRHRGRTVTVVDLPGTYSLLAGSPEEQVARDFLCFAAPDATVVVVDATCLERNLNLVLQVGEITPRMLVCLNLMDEARRRGMRIDAARLAEELGVPVVPTAARRGEGLHHLKETIDGVLSGVVRPAPPPLTYDAELEAAVQLLAAELAPLLGGSLNPRWAALRLLDGDEAVTAYVASSGRGRALPA